jgi:hypothetical protein
MKNTTAKSVRKQFPDHPKCQRLDGKGTVGPTGSPPKKAGITSKGYAGGAKKSR